MFNNFLTAEGTYRTIMVTNNNEVIVKEAFKAVDEKDVMRMDVKKKYQLVTILKVGKDKFAQCAKGPTVDWYNLNLCKQILSLDNNDSVRVLPVAGEAYFKVVDGEEVFAYIYDSAGNLIAKEKHPTKIDVIFSASGPCLQKTDSKGAKKLYTFEGHLVG